MDFYIDRFAANIAQARSTGSEAPIPENFSECEIRMIKERVEQYKMRIEDEKRISEKQFITGSRCIFLESAVFIGDNTQCCIHKDIPFNDARRQYPRFRKVKSAFSDRKN
jgi:hypothetical protein